MTAPARAAAPPVSPQVGDAGSPAVDDGNELVGTGVGDLDQPGGEAPPSEMEAGAEGGEVEQPHPPVAGFTKIARSDMYA